MRNFLNRVCVLAAMALLFASPVKASDPTVYNAQPSIMSGAYVSVGGGYQLGDTQLDLAVGPGVTLNGLSQRGWVGDGRLGIDWQAQNTGLVFGVLGGYRYGSSDFDLNAGAFSILHAEIEPTWYVGGRVGFIPSGTRTMFYGGAAYSQADLTISSGLVPGVFSKNIHGVMYLGGIETQLSSKVRIGAEYNFTEYDLGLPVPGLKATTDVHAIMGRLTLTPF